MDFKASGPPAMAWLLTKTFLRVMKIVAVLMCAFCMQLSAKTSAQKITLNEKNVSLQQVFVELHKQTGFQFFYNDELLDKAGKIDINVRDASLEEALNVCFKNLPYTFEIIEKAVVVKEKQVEKKLPQSPIDVHGLITDENNNPLQGVNITVKGTRIIVSTDANGIFNLKNVDSNSTLLVSFVGYQNADISLKGKTAITFQMKVGANAMQDVVVSKGYYTQKQMENTGNVAIVSGKDIQKQPVTDPILALEGRAAGLSISQVSGLPGAYSIVRLRGQNTIPDGKPVTANDPLYIVDGVPFSSQSLTSTFIGGGAFGTPRAGVGTYEYHGAGQGISPFNSLNPSDIESIEVLKDADATAIYGSRGANGVILITTKRGRAGKNKLDFNIYSGTSRVTRKMDLLNTPQYLEMRREAIKNDGLGPLSSANPLDFPDLLIWDTTRYTDWQKVLLSNSNHFTNAQINYSGGNANTQFLVGGGYSRQDAIFPGTYLDQKASIHLSLTTASSNQKFHSQVSIMYISDNSNMPSQDLTQYITLEPDAPPLYDATGNLNWERYGGTRTWNNPLAYTKKQAKAISELSSGNLQLRYNLFSGVDISCNAGYSEQRMDQTNLNPSTAVAPPLNTIPAFRSSSFSLTKNRSWILEPQLNYAKQISRGNLELLIGTTFQEDSRDSRAETGSGYSNDALLTNIMAATTKNIAGYSNSLYRYNALFGRIGYSWDSKYVLNFTARRDGSSRFGPNRQFGNFGAAGLAWIFSNENWIHDHFSFLSFGKLRGSFGVTGNDQIGDYQYLSTYSSNGLVYQNISGLFPTVIANPYFQWERVKKLEGGIEIGILRDAVFFSVSYYRNRTDDQLVGYPLPRITGFGSVQANFPALIQNTGWEFTAHIKNINQKNFTWTTDFNLSIPRNKLVNYPGIEKSPYAYTYVVGQPLSIQFLLHHTGVDPQTGFYQVASKTGDGTNASTAQDLYPVQTVTQSYFGGIENSFHYKRIQLDFLIQFVKQVGYNYLQSFAVPGTQQNQPVEVMGRWQKPGDNVSIQQFTTYDPHNTYFNYQYSDAAFSDASFVRLKNVVLSYTLGESFRKKVHLENARIYMQCQNLLTITSYKGLDPETQGLSLPPLRTITAGIQLTF